MSGAERRPKSVAVKKNFPQEKKYRLKKPEETDALVMHCCDPRFQVAFRQFIEEELGIKTPIPIVVPGAVHDLISQARVEAGRQLEEQFVFMVTKTGVRRIFLFNHDDCKWYARWSSAVNVGEVRYTEDLTAVAANLIEKTPGVEVECYFAKIEDGGVVFQRVGRQSG